MFICNSCLEKRFNNHPSISRSYGKCEICGNQNDCSDIPSKYLIDKNPDMFQSSSKETNMKEKLPRVWYYLLDFNDRDGYDLIYKMFKTISLNELTFKQCYKLFQTAYHLDVNYLDEILSNTNKPL